MNASSHLRSSSQPNFHQRTITKGNVTFVYNASGKLVWATERIFHPDSSAYDEFDPNYWSTEAIQQYLGERRANPINVPQFLWM
jgi:hypothetical protein